MKNPKAFLNAICRIDDKLGELTLSCKDEKTVSELIKIRNGDLENIERVLELIIKVAKSRELK